MFAPYKIRFYLPIGFVTALVVCFMVYNKISSTDFIVAGILYFLTGFFLGWRVEYKKISAAVLMLIPLTLYAICAHFASSIIDIDYVYAIVLITFTIGFIISEFWNYKVRMIKFVLLLLLITGGFFSVFIYSKAVYGDFNFLFTTYLNSRF